ncbi:MAG: protein-disulfide reductase DsbD family protein [Rhizobiaceae bacterium]
MIRFLILSALLGTAFTVQPAVGASSAWVATEGGDIRLVVDDQPAEDGVLKGALEILLKPGWKTYWLDPGDAGVPPQIDVGASRDVSTARFLFPAPERFDDGYAVWAGYKHQISLALEFAIGRAPLIEADVFLGICETICIPVSARFTVDPSASGASSSDAAAVAAAFAALPGMERDDFAVRRLDEEKPAVLRASVALPRPDEEATLFMASGDGWYFGTPVFRRDETGPGFDIPLLDRPKEPAAAEFFYTLVSEEGAVSGHIDAPAVSSD